MTAEKLEEVGTIVSTPLGPSPSHVAFVASRGNVHRSQYVEMDSPEGKVIALVTNVLKTNRYFERAEAVKEFEASGKKLFEQFPTSDWEYLVAETRPMGVFDGTTLKRPSLPPSPGTPVHSARPETLKQFIGFKEDGLRLGKLDFHDVDVSLPLSRVLQKHLAVLAMSGSGKSYFVSVLLEELLKRRREDGRIAVIVLDVHGEYTSFAERSPGAPYRDFSGQTRLIRARDIRIAVSKLGIGFLSKILPGLSAAQKRDLEKVLEQLKHGTREGREPFTLATVKHAVQQDSEIPDKTKGILSANLSNLEKLHLFDKTESPSLYDIVSPGTLTVIDLSDVVSVQKKQIIVAYFADKMFLDRREKRLPPFTLVLEEAHQFIPEKVKAEHAIAKKAMQTIAREGRKFGASLCLVSQRPTHLDVTTLSQCGTQFILRITNPNDLKQIEAGSEGIDRGSLDLITSLRVGEALIVGEAVNVPVFFRVRKRESPESRHEVSLEEAARAFEENRSAEVEEAKEFL